VYYRIYWVFDKVWETMEDFSSILFLWVFTVHYFLIGDSKRTSRYDVMRFKHYILYSFC